MNASGLKDLFEPFDDVVIKRMFGGHGIYSEGLCFAPIRAISTCARRRRRRSRPASHFTPAPIRWPRKRMVLADLAPGFAAAPKGGVAMLADLQAQGWVYLRP